MKLAEDKKKELTAKRNKHTAERRVRQAANIEAKEEVENKTADRKARRETDVSLRNLRNYIEKEVEKGPADFGIDPDDI